MARYFFNGDVSAASQRETFAVFTDQALTAAATDLLSEDGSAVTVVTRGMDFYGPDGVTTLWGRVSNDTNIAPVRFDATDAPASGTSPSSGTYDSGNSGNGYTAALGSHPAPFAFVSGDALLDLTDPLAPTVVDGGVYAVTVTFSPDSAPVADGTSANLTLNTGSDLVQAYSARLSAGVVDTPLSASATAYIPAGGPLAATLANKDADTVWYLQVSIVKVT